MPPPQQLRLSLALLQSRAAPPPKQAPANVLCIHHDRVTARIPRPPRGQLADCQPAQGQAPTLTTSITQCTGYGLVQFRMFLTVNSASIYQ